MRDKSAQALVGATGDTERVLDCWTSHVHTFNVHRGVRRIYAKEFRETASKSNGDHLKGEDEIPVQPRKVHMCRAFYGGLL